MTGNGGEFRQILQIVMDDIMTAYKISITDKIKKILFYTRMQRQIRLFVSAEIVDFIITQPDFDINKCQQFSAMSFSLPHY